MHIHSFSKIFKKQAWSRREENPGGRPGGVQPGMAVAKEEASEKPWQRCQENPGKRAKEGRRGQLRQMMQRGK